MLLSVQTTLRLSAARSVTWGVAGTGGAGGTEGIHGPNCPFAPHVDVPGWPLTGQVLTSPGLQKACARSAKTGPTRMARTTNVTDLMTSPPGQPPPWAVPRASSLHS